MMGKKDAAKSTINTILGKGSDFQGDFTAEGSARIDGNVNGSVKVTGSLIVGSTGIIHGDVEAGSAIIGGEVLGNIAAADKAELTATAKVIGDVATKVIVIDEHAVFQGRCDMNQEGIERKKPAMVRAKAARAGRKSAKAALEEALKEVEEEEKREAMEGGQPDAVAAISGNLESGTIIAGNAAETEGTTEGSDKAEA